MTTKRTKQRKQATTNTTTVAPVFSPGTSYRVDTDEFASDIRDAVGAEVGISRSQRSLEIERGYARVTITNGYEISSVHGCREVSEDDEGTGIETYLFSADADWYDQAVAWCAAVLRTGRTVACGQGINARALRRDFAARATRVNYPLRSLVRWVEGPWEKDYGACERLVLTPDYQRGAVWTDKQASLFVGAWLEGLPLPSIFIQRYDSQDNAPEGKYYMDCPSEVIDGQQRIRAYVRWYKGEIPAEISDGRQFWYRDTNERDRRGFDVVVGIVDLSRLDRLRLYVQLNRGGTAHTDAEIEHAMALLAKEEMR